MEIEKSLNKGATSGAGDSGTSSRSFATLLSWMNDRKSACFIIATSNDFTVLPPELIRKGRFDDCFWLGLPQTQELENIFEVILRKYKRDPKQFDVAKLAKTCKGWTGAEVEALVQSVMFDTFAAGNADITTRMLVEEALETTPQSKINETQFKEMELAASNKLRMAATITTECEITKAYRKIEI